MEGVVRFSLRFLLAGILAGSLVIEQAGAVPLGDLDLTPEEKEQCSLMPKAAGLSAASEDIGLGTIPVSMGDLSSPVFGMDFETEARRFLIQVHPETGKPLIWREYPRTEGLAAPTRSGEELQALAQDLFLVLPSPPTQPVLFYSGRSHTDREALRVIIWISIVATSVGLIPLLIWGCYFLQRWAWGKYFILGKHIADLTTADGKVFEGMGVFASRRDHGSIVLLPTSKPSGLTSQSVEANAESYILEIQQLDGNGNLGKMERVEAPSRRILSVGYHCFPRCEQRVTAVVKFRQPMPDDLQLSLVCSYPLDVL